MVLNTACSTLATCNTLSGILFGLGIIIVIIFILRNEMKNIDYDEFEDEFEEDEDEYEENWDWWK